MLASSIYTYIEHWMNIVKPKAVNTLRFIEWANRMAEKHFVYRRFIIPDLTFLEEYSEPIIAESLNYSEPLNDFEKGN